MPTIVLQRPVVLPIAALRSALQAVLPEYRWRIGDDDEGGASEVATLDRPQTLMGRRDDEMVMMSIELRRAPLPLEAGAPPHQLHLHLSHPSTDRADVAKSFALAACAALVIGQDEQAMAQIAPNGPWYDVDALRQGLVRATAGQDRGSVDDFLLSAGEVRPSAAAAGAAAPSPLASVGMPAGSPAERLMLADLDQTFARLLTEVGGADFARSMGRTPPPPYADEKPRLDRLPTFVIALDHPLAFDWAPLDRLDEFDPEGGWRAAGNADGSGTLTGRGVTITLTAVAEGVPTYCLDNALARSFWFTAGRAPFAGHSASLVITCDLDTRAAPYEDVRETAKVMSLLLGLLTRTPGAIALLNAGVGTLLDPDMVQSQVGHLFKNQIPLMLWTWTAPDSMVDNAVSLSSGGLLPFLGYEIEVWNAPGAAAWVGDKMSKVINYLLQVGPIAKDGDTFSESEGERSMRGFFGQSKANRGEPVPALLIEFDWPGARTAPRADPLPPRVPSPAAPTPPQGPSLARPAGGFGRRTGGFGRRV